jgi:hypothetical protein
MPTKTKRVETPGLTNFLKRFKQGNTLFLTLGNLRSLPERYNQESTADPICPVKFFGGAWTWYAVEAEIQYDDQGKVEDIGFFGKVVGMETELGYFSLRELYETKQKGRIVGLGSFSFRNERDQHFDPRPLSQCK